MIKAADIKVLLKPKSTNILHLYLIEGIIQKKGRELGHFEHRTIHPATRPTKLKTQKHRTGISKCQF